MAKINTQREAAASLNGAKAKFVRYVVEGDPAYDSKVNQVVVSIDGREYYFYAGEVELEDSDKAAVDAFEKKMDDAHAASEEAAAGKEAHLQALSEPPATAPKPEADPAAIEK